MVRKVKAGEEGDVQAFSADERWVKIQFQDGSAGWIAARLVEIHQRAVAIEETLDTEEQVVEQGKEEKPESEVAPETELMLIEKKLTLPHEAIVIIPLSVGLDVTLDEKENAERAIIENVALKSEMPAFSLRDAFITKGIETELPGCGYDDIPCASMIGSQLEVQFVVIGKLEKESGSWQLKLQLVNVSEQSVFNHASLSGWANQKNLYNVPALAVEKLFGVRAAATTHELQPAPETTLEPAAATVTPQAQSTTQSQVAPPANISTTDSGMSSYELAGWVTLGSGIGLLALGAVGQGMAFKTNQDYHNGNMSAGEQNTIWSAVAVSGYGLGGALTITAIALLVYDSVNQSNEGSAGMAGFTAAPVILRKGTGLQLSYCW